MKRIVVFVLLAAALWMSDLLPFQSSDVAELVPVEALTVQVKDGQVILNGGECQGYGEDWESALEDLHQGAEGQVFLGTAEQIVFSSTAITLVPEVIASDQLRPAAVVCACPGEPPKPDDISKYLSAHDAGLTVQDIQAALIKGERIALPTLQKTEGGLRLYGPKSR